MRVLVCTLLPHDAAQAPNAVHCDKFSPSLPCLAFLAASMEAVYSSFSRSRSISAKIINFIRFWGTGMAQPPMWPEFDSQTQRHMCSEFVGSLLCTERFSPGTPVFPSSQKPTFDLR